MATNKRIYFSRKNRGFNLFAKYLKRFGLLNGLSVYARIKLGKSEKLTLPGYKHPLTLRAKTSDITIFQNVFLDDEYKINFEGNPKVIVDCGANIGLFALQMKRRYPEARIICLEPDPDNYAILKANVGADPDIICLNCGIWNKNTLLRVYDKYGKGKWGMVVEEDLVQGTVPAISMHFLCEEYGLETIDILKIDIETSEIELFSENYNWLCRVDTIVIELHDWMRAGCSSTFFKAVSKTMTAYTFFSKGENIIIRQQPQAVLIPA